MLKSQTFDYTILYIGESKLRDKSLNLIWLLSRVLICHFSFKMRTVKEKESCLWCGERDSHRPPYTQARAAVAVTRHLKQPAL